MYTSYSSLGGRSRSTTDIFKAYSLDDKSQPPMTYAGATLTRTSSSITTVNTSIVNRRRRAAARADAPAPPQRSDSFSGVAPSALKRARADDARLRLMETSTPTHDQAQHQAAQTPRTTFVQKLVASLERRQREISGAYCKAADDEFFVEKNSEVDETSMLENEKRLEKIINRLAVDAWQHHTYTRLPTARLEDLQERENEDDDEEVDDFSDLEDEPAPAAKLWSTRDQVAPPIAAAPPKPTFQSTIKNMFSSILKWRTGSAKNLPKGSREYYATRESLGDEMGTFRKHTMPRLIEHATSKGRLNRSRGETSRRNLQEFSDFIGEPKQSLDETICKPSIATIHPVYGTLKRSMSRVQEIKPAENKEVGYGSVKLQRPAVPIRHSSLPTEHHLSQLPSKLGDQYKRTTCTALMMESTATVIRASSVVYDVPRSSHRLVKLGPKLSPPKYENFKQIDGRDKRDRDSMFTKF